jgi:uncharacterized protein (TIGR02217 family)
MSSNLFPALVGLGWDIPRTPLWSTGVMTSLSGKTSAIAKRQYPLIHYELKFDLLRDYPVNGINELRQIVGFFNAAQGRFDSWLFNDPDFNSVTEQPFGVVGSATTYQLVATYEDPAGGHGQDEIVQNLNGTPTLYANGALISSSTYSIGPTGQVTFTTLPSSGDALTWSGAFYYRCRFDDDDIKGLKKSMLGIWYLDSLPFTSVKL